MVPTVEAIEEYLENLEDFLSSSLAVVTPDLPNVREAVHRLWLDVSRFGPQNLPSLPDIYMPGLSHFEVPPPPPPPPSRTWLESSADWLSCHPWTVGGVAVGVVGAGLLVGYTSMNKHGRLRQAKATIASSERRQVIIVLGGDHPLGLPLIKDLEHSGYIVITSVATADAVKGIESKCNGFVRALVLDPEEPETTPIFIRSLTSTMSRRFPITASGDPHASPSSHPYVHSIISLLTLPTTSTGLPYPTPFEHLPIQSTYLPYLTATHVTPLRALQELLPFLRTSPARTRDSISNNRASKSIVVCVPATDARVGLPFHSAQAMSAAATLRGVEVLRREITAAAITDPTGSMKNINVVVVDVGSLGSVKPQALTAQDIQIAMGNWTSSERVAYGPAISSYTEAASRELGGVRTPEPVDAFVSSMVQVVSSGRKVGSSTKWPQPVTTAVLGLGLGKIRNWIRGDRFAVGAGAHTYTVASYLPSAILNTLLNIPQFIISLRNRLLPMPPTVVQPYPPAEPSRAPAAVAPELPPATVVEKATGELSEHHDEAQSSASETGSEADIESNDSGSGVESSWIHA